MGGRAATMALLEEEERERKERAVGEQQQKEGAARWQRGTRGTRASFGGAVANLALVTPAKYRGVTNILPFAYYLRFDHIYALLICIHCCPVCVLFCF